MADVDRGGIAPRRVAGKCRDGKSHNAEARSLGMRVLPPGAERTGTVSEAKPVHAVKPA